MSAISMKKHLSRRTILRGLGAAITLPALDAMFPVFAGPVSGAAAPTRMAFVYIPNGVESKYWRIADPGPLKELPRILKPLESVKQDISMLSGLAQYQGEALGDGVGDHARASAVYLTGVHCRKTEGSDILNGVSIDQIAAQHQAGKTRFPSLELGIEDGRQLGVCDPGYSCVYTNNLSWRSPTAPNPPETNPRTIFERLFGVAGEDPATRAKRARREKSILDVVTAESKRLQGDLGPTDRRKLDEYLTSVRDIEQRIETAEVEFAEAPAMDRPAGVPANYADHTRLIFDLMATAFQTDQTRVATFMMGREQTSKTFREIGISDGFHPLTHHSNAPEMVEKVAQIDVYLTEQFHYFVEKLKSMQDGDGSLLDHSMVVYGAGLGDGNEHTHSDLPTLIAGKAFGIPLGQNIGYQKLVPMTNLFLTMLDRMGAQMEYFGDSTGKLDSLPKV